MAQHSGGEGRTVAEQEAQRAAEQEALRNVRHLTDELEREQRERKRFANWGWVVAAIGVLALAYAVFEFYVRSASVPPAGKIEIPGKVVVPAK